MTPEQQTLEGGCACGEVRYRLESAPIFVNCCHCYWCQRESGAAFAVNVIIEASRVSLLRGQPLKVETPSNSGKGQDIFRCPNCFVTLWSNYSAAGDKLHFVRGGTLDNTAVLQPGAHIFIESKQPWVVIPDGQPSFEQYYDRKTLWPAESLERRQRALA